MILALEDTPAGFSLGDDVSPSASGARQYPDPRKSEFTALGRTGDRYRSFGRQAAVGAVLIETRVVRFAAEVGSSGALKIFKKELDDRAVSTAAGKYPGETMTAISLGGTIGDESYAWLTDSRGFEADPNFRAWIYDVVFRYRNMTNTLRVSGHKDSTDVSLVIEFANKQLVKQQ